MEKLQPNDNGVPAVDMQEPLSTQEPLSLEPKQGFLERGFMLTA